MKTELEIANERILELEEQVKKLTSNTVLAEVPYVDKGYGKCVRCKQSWAVTDYNGYGHWVCDHCDRMLESEFEDEYR